MSLVKPKSGKIIKTIRQYSEPLPEETMEFLHGIAEDYAKVKSYVYRRYSGIRSLEKIYPGYTVQNEMNATGLRQELNLPYSYYSLAMFEALGSIKSAWSKVKCKIIFLVKQNESLSDEERHYIFTILRRDAMYAAVLNRLEFERPAGFEKASLNFKRLDSLICRLTRRYMIKPRVNVGGGYFRVDKTAYRYKNTCFTLTSRTPYQRVSIPLKDNAAYTKQITVRLLTDRVELLVPVEAKIRLRADYVNKIALHLGYSIMLTSSGGNEYGDELGTLLSRRSERIFTKRRIRGSYYSVVRKSIETGNKHLAEKIKSNNLGSKKFISQNRRELSSIQSYINAEINRMLETEKPREIIIPERTKQFASDMKRAAKQKLSRWIVGYIRKRLYDKCAVNGVQVTEICTAYTSTVCSRCGAVGRKTNLTFICENCGKRCRYSLNAARNLYKKAEGIF